ncbi:MAG: SPASM domain-containing protein [Thermodesulfobacteriota bacterium]
MDHGTMEITTVVGCGVRCRYCPQGRLVARYRGMSGVPKMSFDLFRDCLRKIPPGVRIDFSGMAEPWTHPECTRMLLHAAEEGRKIAVYTTLKGMTHRDFDALREVEYDYFVIHVPDALGNSDLPVNDVYLGLLDRVVRHPLNVTGERQFSCHGPLHPSVRPIVDGAFPVFDTLIDRAGNVRESGLQACSHAGRITCGRAGDRLNHNVLLPDGTVLLCCMDYNMEHILGNLAVQEYVELLESTASRSVLRSLEEEGEPLSLCRRCSAAVGMGNREADLVGRVERLYLSGETASALRLARDIARKHPGNATNWNNLGVILDGLGKKGEAAECFRIALSLDGSLGDALANLEALGISPQAATTLRPLPACAPPASSRASG